MGCEVDEAACPALFLKDIEDWGLRDPAGKGVDETREIREEIYGKALSLLLEMPEADQADLRRDRCGVHGLGIHAPLLEAARPLSGTADQAALS